MTNTLKAVLDEFKERYLELSLVGECFDYRGDMAGIGSQAWSDYHAMATKFFDTALSTIAMAERVALRLGMKESDFLQIVDEWKAEHRKQYWDARDRKFKNVGSVSLYK